MLKPPYHRKLLWYFRYRHCISSYIPVNVVIENMTGLTTVAQLNPLHGLSLLGISVALTLLGGMLPARMAAKKDPVEALRTE